jgi:hypothetical protein
MVMPPAEFHFLGPLTPVVVQAWIVLFTDRRVLVELLDRNLVGGIGGADDEVPHPDCRRARRRSGDKGGLKLGAELVGHLPDQAIGRHPSEDAARQRIAEAFAARQPRLRVVGRPEDGPPNAMPARA